MMGSPCPAGSDQLETPKPQVLKKVFRIEISIDI